MGGVLVGGVSQLYQGDLDVGRLAAERLAAEDLGHGVAVEDFHYGAVTVAQRLEEVVPHTLVLVGAEERGRPAATLERRRIPKRTLSAAEVQAAVGDAVTGYVAIDLILDVASGLGALPARTVTVELEPVVTTGASLSGQAAAALPELLEMVRAEVRRAPVVKLAGEVRERLDGDRFGRSPAVDAMNALLDDLDGLDRDGGWGAAFVHREQVQARIAAGQTPEGMEHLDWALWWTLLEEVGRLLPTEGIASS